MNAFNDRPVAGVLAKVVISDPESNGDVRFPHYAGIELELENVAFGGKLKQWKVVPDDSLRNGQEFVTREPYAAQRLDSAITEFFSAKVVSDNSPRTSTHIHINVTDMTVGNLRTMFAISYMIEAQMFRVLATDRKYCGYCMQLTDMNPKRATTFLSSNEAGAWTQSMGGPNANKYYGFNINSIKKHGTAEFRYFPGGPSEEDLTHWMLYCQEVKSAAIKTGLDAFINMESVAEVEHWVRSNFSAWGEAMISDGGSAEMFEHLQEIAAMIPDEEEAERRERLVFVSEPLVKFAASYYLKSQYKEDFLRKNLLPLKVVTLNEWYDRLEQAKAHVSPEEQAQIDARRERDRLARGEHGKEVNFDQFCRRHFGHDNVEENYDRYVAFLRRHKQTLIDMYKEHRNVMRREWPEIPVTPFTEGQYVGLIDPEQRPRFQDAAPEQAPPPPAPARDPWAAPLYPPPNARVSAAQARAVEQLRRLAEQNRAAGALNPWFAEPQPMRDGFEAYEGDDE